MLLAAGVGTRMRPITHKLPKPLIKVGGRTLLDHSLDRLADAGVETVVVNIHHLGHLVQQHLKKRKTPEIVFSVEDDLLETGGGVTHALPLLGDEPFFVVNADILWLNGPMDALVALSAAWDGERMDALLLTHFTIEAHGYRGRGDFTMDGNGRLARRLECEVSPYLFTGIQILHPRLFKGVSVERFSLNRLFDRAIEAERLYGFLHDGEWFDVGTPEALAEVKAYMLDRHPVKLWR